MTKEINKKQLKKKFNKDLKKLSKESNIKKTDILDFIKRFFGLKNGLFSLEKIKNFFKN